MTKLTKRLTPSARAGLKNAAAAVLCGLGLPWVARRRHQDRLAILMFHGIEPEPLSPACWHVVDVGTFRRQLRYLHENFCVLPLEDALERLADGTIPARAVALTFDDGTQNLADHALPVLREFDLPAAVFITTGPVGTNEVLWPDRLWLAFARTKVRSIDLADLGLGVRSLDGTVDRSAAYAAAVGRLKDLPDERRIAMLEELLGILADVEDDPGPFRMLSWEQARRIAADGRITLYPHAVTHPILSRCSDEKVEREIADSCAAIERETRTRPTIFAYPNGRRQDFDDRSVAALHRRGIRWALATSTGFVVPTSDRMALPRLPIGSDTTFAYFRLLVSGGVPTGSSTR